MIKKFFRRRARNTQLVLWFKELGIKDVPLVGGKNASLGEMYQKLTKKKVRIPNGFAVTAYSYHYMTEQAGIKDDIRKILKGLNPHDIRDLQEAFEGFMTYGNEDFSYVNWSSRKIAEGTIKHEKGKIDLTCPPEIGPDLELVFW